MERNQRNQNRDEQLNAFDILMRGNRRTLQRRDERRAERNDAPPPVERVNNLTEIIEAAVTIVERMRERDRIQLRNHPYQGSHRFNRHQNYRRENDRRNGDRCNYVNRQNDFRSTDNRINFDRRNNERRNENRADIRVTDDRRRAEEYRRDDYHRANFQRDERPRENFRRDYRDRDRSPSSFPRNNIDHRYDRRRR